MMNSLLILIALTTAPTPTVIEKIEARVGSEIITSTDIDLVVDNLQEQTLESKSEKTLQDRALKELINAALIRDYLRRVQMSVNEQDVDRRINSIRVSNEIGTLEEFRQMLEAQGMSFDRYRSELKRQMELAQFDSVIQRQQLQSIDEKEMLSFYNGNKVLFENNFDVGLQECVISVQELGDEKAQKLARLYLNDPRNFKTCVQQYSRSPSAAREGELGEVSRGMLREEIEKKVFSAEVGSVVEIKMPQAIQLLKITSRKDKGALDFEDVKTEIRQMIEAQRMSQARESALDSLRSSTFIRLGS